jgi:hypothetical protein
MFLLTTKINLSSNGIAGDDTVVEDRLTNRGFTPPLAVLVALLALIMVVLWRRSRRRRLGVPEGVAEPDRGSFESRELQSA